MKRSVATVLMMFAWLGLAVLQIASAQVYKCGRTWSSQPCGKGSTPVTNLPAVRESEYAEGTHRRRVTHRPTSSCSPVANGFDISIYQTATELVYDAARVSVSVKNSSSKTYHDRLLLSIYDPATGMERIVLLSSFLPYASQDVFEVDLRSFLVLDGSGEEMTLELIYYPAKSCKKTATRLFNAQYKGANSGAGSVRLAAVNLNKALSEFEEDVEAISQFLLKKYSGITSADRKIVQREVNVLRVRLKMLCEAFAYLSPGPECRQIEQDISKLADKLKSIKGV